MEPGQQVALEVDALPGNHLVGRVHSFTPTSRNHIALLPADMPRLAAIAVDGPVLATVVMVSVIAVLTFGVAPTLFANRPGRLTASLRVGASGPGPAARRALHLLVVGQVALATVIGAGALLMARSLSAHRRS